jgi:hypothetical protein
LELDDEEKIEVPNDIHGRYQDGFKGGTWSHIIGNTQVTNGFNDVNNTPRECGLAKSIRHKEGR